MVEAKKNERTNSLKELRRHLIEIALQQLPDNLLSDFKSFGVVYRKAKYRDANVRKINNLFNRLPSLFGNTYRSHLIQ
jgi:hypothetical protein